MKIVQKVLEVAKGMWKKNLEKEILCMGKLTKIIVDLFKLTFTIKKYTDTKLEFGFLC